MLGILGGSAVPSLSHGHVPLARPQMVADKIPQEIANHHVFRSVNQFASVCFLSLHISAPRVWKFENCSRWDAGVSRRVLLVPAGQFRQFGSVPLPSPWRWLCLLRQKCEQKLGGIHVLLFFFKLRFEDCSSWCLYDFDQPTIMCAFEKWVSTGKVHPFQPNFTDVATTKNEKWWVARRLSQNGRTLETLFTLAFAEHSRPKTFGRSFHEHTYIYIYIYIYIYTYIYIYIYIYIWWWWWIIQFAWWKDWISSKLPQALLQAVFSMVTQAIRVISGHQRYYLSMEKLQVLAIDGIEEFPRNLYLPTISIGWALEILIWWSQNSVKVLMIWGIWFNMTTLLGTRGWLIGSAGCKQVLLGKFGVRIDDGSNFKIQNPKHPRFCSFFVVVFWLPIFQLTFDQ